MPKNTALGKYFDEVRARAKTGTLPFQRRLQLEDLGFALEDAAVPVAAAAATTAAAATAAATVASSSDAAGSDGRLLGQHEVIKMEKQRVKMEAEKEEWSRMYEQIVQFKQVNGVSSVFPTCQHGKRAVHKYGLTVIFVPLLYTQHSKIPKTTPLGKYCDRLRQKKASNSLPFQRQCLLEDVGFQWSFRDETFEERLKQLEQYRLKFGVRFLFARCSVCCTSRRSIV